MSWFAVPVSYDPDHDIAEIQTLVDELVSAASRIEKKLDATLAKVGLTQFGLE